MNLSNGTTSVIETNYCSEEDNMKIQNDQSLQTRLNSYHAKYDYPLTRLADLLNELMQQHGELKLSVKRSADFMSSVGSGTAVSLLRQAITKMNLDDNQRTILDAHDKLGASKADNWNTYLGGHHGEPATLVVLELVKALPFEPRRVAHTHPNEQIRIAAAEAELIIMDDLPQFGEDFAVLQEDLRKRVLTNDEKAEHHATADDVTQKETNYQAAIAAARVRRQRSMPG